MTLEIALAPPDVATDESKESEALPWYALTPVSEPEDAEFPLSLIHIYTAALDPKTAEIIMELTNRIVREKKLTALMVTHNLRYALEYGDRLLMMHQGGIVLDKAGEEKQNVRMDDILKIFNEISIECGN